VRPTFGLDPRVLLVCAHGVVGFRGKVAPELSRFSLAAIVTHAFAARQTLIR
jgi:hypothetical protein